MTSQQAAYLAGLIDGEGWVAIYRDKRAKEKGYRGQPRIIVNMTCPEVLEWAHEITGLGSLQTARKCGPKRKTLYRWQVVSRQAEKLALQIARYSIVKRAELQAILDHYSGS
jgi:hypothetical protein